MTYSSLRWGASSLLSLWVHFLGCRGDALGQCNRGEQIMCSPSFQKQVFATTEPLYERDMTSALFPEMEDQGDDVHTCGLGSKYIWTDSCAQIHQPATEYHGEYGLGVHYVQEQLAQKWAHVKDDATSAQYDAFFDNSVALWTNDLAYYYNVWAELGADLVLLRWHADVDKNGKHPLYSLITHHPGTLSQYELISDTFDLDAIAKELRGNLVFVDSEPRAYFIQEDVSDYRDLIGGCDLYPIGARRAVSNVALNVAWYQKMFGASINEPGLVIFGETSDYNGQLVRYAHVRLEASSVRDATTISFFERSERSSFGELSVQGFENGMNEAHGAALVSPFCGIDRWFDMHYAFVLDKSDNVVFDVLETVVASGEKYSVYLAGPGSSQAFIYMPEPNGHSLQIVFTTDDDFEWLIEPVTWDKDWCPMECEDDQNEVQFGDAIFVRNNGQDGASAYKMKQNEMNVFEKTSGAKDFMFGNGVVLICVLVGVVALCLAGVVVFMRNDQEWSWHKSRFSYSRV